MMLQGRQPYIYGDGNQKRCFSFISDDIAPLKQMAFDPACVGEVINIGPDDEFVTINELAELIARLIHFELDDHIHARAAAGGPARQLLGRQGAAPARLRAQGEARGRHAQMIDWISKRGARPFKYHLDLEIMNEKTPDTWSKRLF